MQPSLDKLLFIDIETASIVSKYEELSNKLKEQWDKKAEFFKRDSNKTSSELFKEKAAIYAEYGKVICVGIGAFYEDSKQLKFKATSIHDDSEKDLLKNFIQIVKKHKAGKDLVLCAHNGKEFDFPYLCRRILINRMPLPEVLNLSGKKPWEINHIDTLELWKFGDYKHYTSLDLLATLFGIPSSKTEISGKDVSSVYYEEKNLKKISDYCLADVRVLGELYLRMTGNFTEISK